MPRKPNKRPVRQKRQPPSPNHQAQGAHWPTLGREYGPRDVMPSAALEEIIARAADQWRADLEAQCMKALLCGAEPHNPTTYARSDIESPGLFNYRWWRKLT